MPPNLNAALATARQADLERQAGCCTPLVEHRRTLRRSLRERLGSRRAATIGAGVCCT